MTQHQIQELFKHRYNQTTWKQFIGETFANVRLLTTPEVLLGINTNIASKVQKLGYIQLDENGIERQIAIYDVTLAQGIILERNRVGLRNLLRKYWKDIDAAFITYHHPDDANWRFTYVSELTGFDGDGEFIKIKTEPKRYTYVLGEGESTRTAVERFTILAAKGSKAALDDVKEAFSVEKLSIAFFDEYKKHYEIFCDFMVSKPQIRQTIFNGDEKGVRDFNKKLLGRIVFLYFIQKKGWLGVPIEKNWGEGNFNFITELFDNFKNPDFFYSEILTKLFFDTLNSPRKKDLVELVKGQICRIPFLNGGLFEEENEEYRKINIPGNLFKNLFKFFNQYNFTIYEDDPNDHTVAVDPEMLGHIFENLLEDNKDKGAFYTPKEIVHYMCQESLIEYLCTSLNIEDEAKEKEAITNLLKKKEIDSILRPEIININKALDNVKICDPAIGSGAFPMGLLIEIFTAKQTLHAFEFGNTTNFDASAVKLNIIQNSIYGVDIEKGAVDIARLRFWLSLIVDEPEPKALPNLDYKIVVGNSLVSKLGDDIVDIDWTLNETAHGLFGADLAKQKSDLLQKISKEQKEFFKPNTDKKILASEIRNLKIDLLITQLELMVKTKGNDTIYSINTKNIAKQTESKNLTIGWKNSIKDLQNLKANPDSHLHFFDWKLDFPEIVNEQVTKTIGFDIVIGNPPYIGEKGHKETFREIKNSPLGTRFYLGKMDLFYFFFHVGLDNLHNSGVLAFITTNYYPTALGARKLREDFKKRAVVNKLVNFNELKIFKSAAGQHNMITILTKGQSNESSVKTCITKNTGDATPDVLERIVGWKDNKTDYYEVVQKDLYDGNNYDIRLSGTSIENLDSLQIILGKIKSQGLRLDNMCDVNTGIMGGCDYISKKNLTYCSIQEAIKRDIQLGDGVFVLNELNERDLKVIKKIHNDHLKNFYKNSDIQRYFINSDTTKRIIFSSKENDAYKNDFIKEHLDKFKSVLEENRKINNENTNHYPFLRRGTAHQYIFESEKIVAPQRSPRNTFGYNAIPWYASADVYFITEKDQSVLLKYVLALLNSKLYYFWLYYRGKRKGEMLELYQQPLSEIPIKKISEPEQNSFIEIVDKILTITKSNDYLENPAKKKAVKEYEKKIDQLVYKLYELTYEEVKVIDTEFSLTQKEYEAIIVE